jgi:hypothetical protein
MSAPTFVARGRLKRQARVPRPPPDLYRATAGGSERSDPTPGRGAPRNRAEAQAALPSSSASAPVQRPLARPRVLLSRRVLAYYGLMRDSRAPPRDLCIIRGVFARRPGLGWEREVPQFAPPVSSRRAAFRTPVDRPSACGRSFLDRPGLRLLCRGSASTCPPPSVLAGVASRGCKVRFMLRPGRIAGPSPTRTVTPELSLAGSPRNERRVSLCGQTANSRSRTCTGKTCGPMGCMQSAQSPQRNLLYSKGWLGGDRGNDPKGFGPDALLA